MNTNTRSESKLSGKVADAVGHYRRPAEHPFLRDERATVTGLFGGLTRRHEELIEAAFVGQGYRALRMPVPTKADFLTGREYCSVGMCNPAYFTIGALINCLRRLRDEEGLSAEEIVRRYLYVTAGSRGPCRFGMYESECRLALKKAGFEGFRVITFQQTGGLQVAREEAGLNLDLGFAFPLVLCIAVGDLFNDLACRVRPYEMVKGSTDACLAKAVDRVREYLLDWNQRGGRAGVGARLLAMSVRGVTPEQVQRLMSHLLGDEFQELLRGCAAMFDEEVEVDYTRPKPVCKVTGEFWAQMTEGDGNFSMFSFLEDQGAEALIEPIMTWADYLFESAQCKLAYERELSVGKEALEGHAAWWRPVARMARWRGKAVLLGITRSVLKREFERMRQSMGGLTHVQIDQREFRRLAQPYFDYRIAGGEGYLEIGKTIYYSTNHLAHMVLSLKPFGCLPSTQSDGAQAAVLADYPDICFVPVETSGEGDVHAYSRVLMALGDAHERSRSEFEECVAATGYEVSAIRRFCRERRELRRPLQCIPEHAGIAGRAANFVLHVASLMDAEPSWSQLKGGGALCASS